MSATSSACFSSSRLPRTARSASRLRGGWRSKLFEIGGLFVVLPLLFADRVFPLPEFVYAIEFTNEGFEFWEVGFFVGHLPGRGDRGLAKIVGGHSWCSRERFGRGI